MSVPEILEIFPSEVLELIAAMAETKPVAPRSQGATSTAPPTSLKAMLITAGIDHRDDQPDANGVQWYGLKTCPWHPDGMPYTCGVGQHPDGKYAAKCFHNRGEGKGWQEFKKALGLGTEKTTKTAVAPPGRGIITQLADAICKDTAFARDNGRKLYRYAGGVYRSDGEGYVKRCVKELLLAWGSDALWSPERASAVVEFITVDAPDLWERPPATVLNVRNGLVDVTTRELREHTPKHLSPIQLPITFDPAADCPAWDAFVAQTFPDDAHAIAYEIPAWLATPDTSIQKAVLLTGDGSNGKSVYLTAVTAFVGAKNVSNVSLHKLEADRFSVARLVGKLANVYADLPSAHLQATSTFKALTGGDTLHAEYKYKDPFEFTPYARQVFSANHFPESHDASHAFFRRFIVIPFERTFEGETAIPRRELDARLADPRELSGVLNRALAVLPQLLAHGFTETESMRAAWTEFRGTTDPLAVWLDANTVEDPDATVLKATLLQAFNTACREAGRPTQNRTSFALALKRLRPRVGERQVPVNGRREWAYTAIGLGSTYAASPTARSARGARSSSNCYPSDPLGDEDGGSRVETTNSENSVHSVHSVQPTDPDQCVAPGCVAGFTAFTEDGFPVCDQHKGSV